MLRRNFLLSVPALLAVAGAKSRRVGPVRTAFKSPGPKPNGLQATDEGLWIIDQGDNHAYLVDYDDGHTIRDLETEADRSSGITFDGEAIWMASTYSRELIRADARTGATLSRFFTPGAGVIYEKTGDAVGRRSPLAKPAATRSGRSAEVNSAPRPGTGAHGLEWRDDRLWVVVPLHALFIASTRIPGLSSTSSQESATVRTASAGKASTYGVRTPTSMHFSSTIENGADKLDHRTAF